MTNSVYGYLGFEGGIQIEEYFGSVSTNYKSGIGKNNGSKIKENEKIILKRNNISDDEYQLARLPVKAKKIKLEF